MWVIDKSFTYFFLHLHLISTHNWIVWFSELFDNNIIFIVFGMIICYKDKKLLLKFITILIIIMLYVFITKYFVARQRPYAMLGIKNYLHLNDFASFPSGHTSISCLFALFITFNNKSILLKVIFWLLALCISLSRIIILAHYFSDVFISFIIVTCIYLTFEYLWKKYFSNSIQ